MKSDNKTMQGKVGAHKENNTNVRDAMRKSNNMRGEEHQCEGYKIEHHCEQQCQHE